MSATDTGTLRAPPTVVLHADDYDGWAYAMRTLLEYGGMWPFVDPTIVATAQEQPADDVTSSTSTSKQASKERDMRTHLQRQAHLMLVSALQDADSRSLLIGLPTGDPRAIWMALERRHRVTTLAALITLKGELWRIKQGKSDSVFEYAGRIRRVVQRIKASGGAVQEEDVTAVFILGLNPIIAQPINTMLTLADSTEIIPLNKLVDIAQSEVSRLAISSSNVNSAIASLPRTFDAFATSVGEGCFLCHKSGHIKVDCPELASRTAGASDVRAGACSLPGHKGHKTSQCKLNQANNVVRLG